MIKGQSKVASVWEACSNTLIGFISTIVISPVIYHYAGISYSNKQLVGVTLAFTVWSVVRGYVVRRIFNKSEAKKESKLAIQVTAFRLQNDLLKVQLQDEREKALNLIHEYHEELDKANQDYHTAIQDIIEQNPGLILGPYISDVNWNRPKPEEHANNS